MKNPNLKEYEYTVGILIFHRNQELVEMAKDCLGSVLACVDRDKTQIIIVDNGSTSRYEWEKHCDVYVRYSENRGISAGWNGILKHARGKYINILGDDTKVASGYLEGLKEALQMPDAGISNVHVEHLPHGIGITEDYKWYFGACFMMSQDTYKKVGLFDEGIFPANHEDLDYWTRVYQAGLKLYKNQTISIQHKEGQTVHAPDISSQNDKTRDYFIKKHSFNPIPVFYGEESIYDVLRGLRGL